MLKKSFAILLSAAFVGGLLGLIARPETSAQPERPRAVKYARGRVAPPNAAKMRAISAWQHGARINRMVKLLTPPVKWDSVAKGWSPPIDDQGQCGSCWDFSGTEMVDAAYLTAGWPGGPSAWMFSQQYTLDCGRNGGCNGDDNTTVLDWAKTTGLPLKSIYGPYQARSGRCNYTTSMQLYKLTDWGYCDPNAGNNGVTGAAYIKSAIMQYGAVGCAVAAGGGWDNYSGGVYHGSGNRSIDHDVLLVGWDDSMSPTEGKTVWKMQNSWGTGWGDQGYMWIVEGGDEIGTEAVWCQAPAPSAPTPPPGPTPPPPGPTPPPVPPTPPTTGWTGTISIQSGIITNVTQTPMRKAG